MTYRNLVSAVVRALAAETINSTGGCDFEPKVQCAKQKGEIVGKEAAFLLDCWVFGRLHKALNQQHWRVLVAKYSTHVERKHTAIAELTRSVRSPAPKRFLHCAVVTWALSAPEWTESAPRTYCPQAGTRWTIGPMSRIRSRPRSCGDERFAKHWSARWMRLCCWLKCYWMQKDSLKQKLLDLD